MHTHVRKGFRSGIVAALVMLTLTGFTTITYAQICSEGEPSCTANCNGTVVPAKQCVPNCCDATGSTQQCSAICTTMVNGVCEAGCCAAGGSGCVTEE